MNKTCADVESDNGTTHKRREKDYRNSTQGVLCKNQQWVKRS